MGEDPKLHMCAADRRDDYQVPGIPPGGHHTVLQQHGRGSIQGRGPTGWTGKCTDKEQVRQV